MQISASESKFGLDAPPRVHFVVRHSGGSRWDNFTLAPPGTSAWGLELCFSRAHVQFHDGREFYLQPGDLFITSPGAVLTFKSLEPRSCIYLAYRTESACTTEGRAWQLDPGDDLHEVESLLSRAVRLSPEYPSYVSCLVWSVLWIAFEHMGGVASPRVSHPAVNRAIELIEVHLHEDLRVAWLARQCGLAPASLARLFQQHLKTTVVAHIRARRMARAGHYLRDTSFSIKETAYRVGIPDLQAFNKAVNRAYDASPREIRRRAELQHGFGSPRAPAQKSQ